MKNYFLFTTAWLLFSFTSCTPSKEKIQENIKQAEAALFGSGQMKLDEKKANLLIENYQQFVDNYPKDSLSPEYLFKQADLYRGLKQADKSIAVYDHIIKNYPTYSKTPYSLFLKGFTYENEKNDIINAAKTYQQFLKEYPTHELADDVSFSLRNLGKSPEELIKQFEQMQKDTTANNTAL